MFEHTTVQLYSACVTWNRFTQARALLALRVSRVTMSNESIIHSKNKVKCVKKVQEPSHQITNSSQSLFTGRQRSIINAEITHYGTTQTHTDKTIKLYEETRSFMSFMLDQ